MSVETLKLICKKIFFSDSPLTLESVTPPPLSNKLGGACFSVPVDNMEDYLILTQIKNDLLSSPLLKTLLLTKVQSSNETITTDKTTSSTK